MGKQFVRLTTLAVCSFGSIVAAPLMYVHDMAGRLATVDVVSGNVSLIGSMGVVMTDIAFDPSGNLFGITPGALYSINRTTADISLIGAHMVPGANALVFSLTGTLYAAGISSGALFSLNPTTGVTTHLGNMGFASGGDLAFYNSDFYLASSTSQLVRVDLSNPSNSVAVGPFGVSSVFGLATGDNNVLYGVAGTQIFSINTVTGAGTNPVNYAGQGLSAAFGQSFISESDPTPEPPPSADSPEPSAYLLMTTGLTALAFRRFTRKSTAV